MQQGLRRLTKLQGRRIQAAASWDYWSLLSGSLIAIAPDLRPNKMIGRTLAANGAWSVGGLNPVRIEKLCYKQRRGDAFFGGGHREPHRLLCRLHDHR
jgi:hypothetical protein